VRHQLSHYSGLLEKWLLKWYVTFLLGDQWSETSHSQFSDINVKLTKLNMLSPLTALWTL